MVASDLIDFVFFEGFYKLIVQKRDLIYLWYDNSSIGVLMICIVDCFKNSFELSWDFKAFSLALLEFVYLIVKRKSFGLSWGFVALSLTLLEFV